MTSVHAPAIGFAPELLLRAQGVRLAFFDVDGVLTDGGLYLVEAESHEPAETREAIKRFDILDGFGLKLLQQAGIGAAVVTGRDSPALRGRLAALGVARARFGVDDKLTAANELLAESGLDWSQAAAIGDDWPDLPLLLRCACAAAPPGAHVEVRAVAHYVTQAHAGHGAAREFCDLLLAASGRYQALLQQWAR